MPCRTPTSSLATYIASTIASTFAAAAAVMILTLAAPAYGQGVEFDLSADDLQTLTTQHTLATQLPNGDLARLELIQHRHFDAYQVITAANDGWVCTVTLNEHGFFATLASASSTYQLQNTGGTTTIIDQRALDARSVGFADDFRRVE